MTYHPTEEHLARLEAGRQQSRAVRRYLTSLNGRRPRRGRPRDWDAALRRAEQAVAEASDPLRRLEAVQARHDLQLARAEDVDGLRAELAAEALVGFVEHGAAYGKTHGISYRAWLEVGVPAKDLRAAGIRRDPAAADVEGV